MINLMNKRNIKSSSKLQITLKDLDNKCYVVDFSNGRINSGKLNASSSHWVCCIDSNYLSAIMNFKSTWDDARISFNLLWEREQNFYDQFGYMGLNFLHKPTKTVKPYF